jgi:hypothetical protein
MESRQVIGREVPLSHRRSPDTWERTPSPINHMPPIATNRRGIALGADVDLGKVQRNQMISHRVWVFNPSLRSVSIEATPSCGCTVVELPHRQLTPLNGFPVEVQVGTWGLPLGYQEKVVGLSVSSGGVRWQERVVVRLEVVD